MKNIIVDLAIHTKETGVTNSRRHIIDIDESDIEIGRDESNNIRIVHETISGKHGQIKLIDNKLLYTDLSTNGATIVSKIAKPKELKKKDNRYIFSGDMIILPGTEKFQAILFIQ